jgi:NAD(P)-dependent dehydrogenase (short-subunit alcohol dehydrogenase family)
MTRAPDEQVVVITGASSGIGRGAADAFAGPGGEAGVGRAQRPHLGRGGR